MLHVSVVFHPIIAEIVRAYRETHPDVRLSPSESNVAALIDDLLPERIDLAIIRQTAQESERLKIEALFDEHMVVALPPQHRLGGEAGISLQSLAQETLIMFPRSIAPVLYDEVMSACQRAGFSPQLGQESTQVASAVSMVAAGFGVSIVPESIRPGGSNRRDIPRDRWARTEGANRDCLSIDRVLEGRSRFPGSCAAFDQKPSPR